jgi:hypothetical protein
VPYDVPGQGILQYPFVVLTHSDGSVNVLLVDSITPEIKNECGGDGDGGGCSCSAAYNSRFPAAVLALIPLPFLAVFLLRRKHRRGLCS